MNEVSHRHLLQIERKMKRRDKKEEFEHKDLEDGVHKIFPTKEFYVDIGKVFVRKTDKLQHFHCQQKSTFKILQGRSRPLC